MKTRILLAILWVFISTVAGLCQYTDHGFLCGGADSISGIFPPPPISREEMAVLVIFSAGCADCQELDGSNYLKPWWSNVILNPNSEISLSRYYADNSHGNLHVIGEVASRPNDDSCFYSRHIPCGYEWGCGMWCDSCPNNCGCACPCRCEYDSFYTDILTQVDGAIDLSQYDRTGPNGVPDGYVDYVVLIHYMYREVGRPGTNMGLGGLLRPFPTQDGVSIQYGITCWVPDNYYPALGLIAHELGHTIRPVSQPDWDHSGLRCYDHMALGSFDIMSGCAFGSDSIEYPSLFNPWSRSQRLNWTPITDINSSNFDLLLQPYADPRVSYSEQSMCYKLDCAASSNQYYLITSHNRESIWESYWPNSGVLVWRVNTNTWANQYEHRERRVLELEPASGLWAWDSVGFAISPYGYRYTAAVNNGTQDPISGHDSLDYRFTLRSDTISDMFARRAGYRGVGGQTQFFIDGNSMDDYANPTTRLRVNQSPNYPRTVKTGIAIRNIRSMQDQSYIADLIVNAWQGTFTMSQSWRDTINVIGNITAASSALLTIHPGTVVRVSPNTRLTVEGSILAQGTSANPIIFECSDPNQKWDQLRIESDDPENVIEHVVVRNARFGIYVRYGHLQLEHARVEHCRDGLVYLYSTGAVLNSTFINNERHGAWIVGQGVGFNHNTCQLNGEAGLRIWKTPDVTLIDNVIRENGTAAQNPSAIAA